MTTIPLPHSSSQANINISQTHNNSSLCRPFEPSLCPSTEDILFQRPYYCFSNESHNLRGHWEMRIWVPRRATKLTCPLRRNLSSDICITSNLWSIPQPELAFQNTELYSSNQFPKFNRSTNQKHKNLPHCPWPLHTYHFQWLVHCKKNRGLIVPRILAFHERKSRIKNLVKRWRNLGSLTGHISATE